MTNDELRALADALEPMAKAPRFEDLDVPGFCAWVRACADEKPVGYVTANGLRSLRQDDATVLLYAHDYLIRPDHVALYTRPAPAAPQAEPQQVFTRWVRDNMPPNTVISDPDWWAARLWRAAMRAHGIGGSDAE